MPIRLNLLAEAQAAEEERRRDPVKQAIWVAALVIVIILVWSSSLQLEAILLHSEVSRLETQINTRSNDYRVVLDNQSKTADLKSKLDALRRLSENRLLQGSLLNALQKTTVADVQLLRLRIEQLYAVVEGTKSRTNEDTGALIPGRPASSTEKTSLTLEGVDSSPNPGDQVNRFKSVLVTNAYFKDMLIKTNPVRLKSLSPPQLAPGTGKPCVVFNLECRYPDKTR
jgi:hypothetical protein